jgi:hypothetical protein
MNWVRTLVTLWLSDFFSIDDNTSPSYSRESPWSSSFKKKQWQVVEGRERRRRLIIDF